MWLFFIFQIFQGCDVVVLRGPCPRLDDCWTDLLPQEVLRGPPGRLEVPRWRLKMEIRFLKIKNRFNCFLFL